MKNTLINDYMNTQSFINLQLIIIEELAVYIINIKLKNNNIRLS